MSDLLARALLRSVFDALHADQGAVDELRRLLEIDPGARPMADAAPDKPLAFTTASFATMVGITERAVRGAIDRGELAAVKRGQRWMIDRASADRYLAATPLRTMRLAERQRRSETRRTMADALARLSGER